MVQKYLDTTGQAIRELSDFCRDGLKRLKEMNYDSTFELTNHYLGHLTQRGFMGYTFCRSSYHGYTYKGGNIFVTYRQQPDPNFPKFNDFESREITPNEIPFVDFTVKELLEVARNIEGVLTSLSVSR